MSNDQIAHDLAVAYLACNHADNIEDLVDNYKKTYDEIFKYIVSKDPQSKPNATIMPSPF